MLDWGYAEFDARHRMAASVIWTLPFGRSSTGAAKALAADWQLNFIFSARTGFPFTLWDSTNGCYYNCVYMRAEDPIGIPRKVTAGTATGNPNEYELIDLARILQYAGGYVNPKTGTSEFGPYPADMTKRNAFRGPGNWNVDFALSKRIRFGSRAVQVRWEAYNLFNHANMYVRASDADVGAVTAVTGYKDGNRRMQLGFKFEF